MKWPKVYNYLFRCLNVEVDRHLDIELRTDSYDIYILVW